MIKTKSNLIPVAKKRSYKKSGLKYHILKTMTKTKTGSVYYFKTYCEIESTSNMYQLDAVSNLEQKNICKFCKIVKEEGIQALKNFRKQFAKK